MQGLLHSTNELPKTIEKCDDPYLINLIYKHTKISGISVIATEIRVTRLHAGILRLLYLILRCIGCLRRQKHNITLELLF